MRVSARNSPAASCRRTAADRLNSVGVRRLASGAIALLTGFGALAGCGGESEDAAPEPRPWALLVPAGLDLDPGATTLKLSIDSGRCLPSNPTSALDRIEVEETADRVVVTPYVRPDTAREQLACLSLIPASAKLDRPLGGRRLVQGSDGKPPDRYELPPSHRPGEGRARRLRTAAIDGARVDFRAAMPISPAFKKCFLSGYEEQLTPTVLGSLIDVREADGNPGVARALNGVAAPVGGECGSKSNVPELTSSAERLGG